jgi:hypothetical protein
MLTVATGRYDNDSWDATLQYRAKRKLACIYASPFKFSPRIELNSPVFVIEMNNSINEIMGIGLIRNKFETDKVYKVQPDTNCNRYIYIGEYYMSRELLNRHNPFLVYVLDEILFKGRTHSKRGAGLTKIPEKVLKFDVCEGLDIKTEIRNIFVVHFRNKNILIKENKEQSRDEN